MIYFIKHNGLFWRPLSQGYTSNILEAGLYEEEEAIKIEKLRRIPGDVKFSIISYKNEIKQLYHLSQEMNRKLELEEKK